MRQKRFRFADSDEDRQSKAISEASALKKLAALCARGEHSTGEADEKMRNWGLDEGARARVIAKLVDNKFIDDSRFAGYFIHDKIKFNHWGRRKIEQALRQKGVDSDTIATALDAVDDEEYLEILRPMIKDKMDKVTARSDYERAMKTIKWAVGRGFSLDLIRQVIDEPEEF